VHAVVTVTPMMQRAHSLPLASNVVFMDTLSCDSENHAITFLLTPCEAEAMPLAVFITSGQRQADYETSFNSLKQAVGENLFGCQHYPKVFITEFVRTKCHKVNIPREFIQNGYQVKNS
jgi:hypothetical protein